MQPKVGVAYQRADNIWPLACLGMHFNVCFYVFYVYVLCSFVKAAAFDGCTSSLASYSVTRSNN